MFGLFLPIVLAAAIPVPTPLPTLPPEIGNVYSRGHCNDGQRTLMKVLPVLIRNDNAIGSALKGMGKVDSREDAATRMTIMHTRTLSDSIFKNLDLTKNDVMKMHVLAAASVNPDQSKQFSAIADSLDTIISQQNAVADQLNGYADTADMGLMSAGSEGERQMARSTGPADNPQALNLERQRHPSLAHVDIGALTTNVYKDVQNMRTQLAATEGDVSSQVKQMLQICATSKHRQ
ncbi:MAG: hypothetical protein NVSMB31_18420 [Vulcanimicrobiaceae bacterium]